MNLKCSLQCQLQSHSKCGMNLCRMLQKIFIQARIYNLCQDGEKNVRLYTFWVLQVFFLIVFLIFWYTYSIYVCVTVCYMLVVLHFNLHCHLRPCHCNIQILTNVRTKTRLHALRSASILWGATGVSVKKAICWIKMGEHAARGKEVRIVFLLIYFVLIPGPI